MRLQKNPKQKHLSLSFLKNPNFWLKFMIPIFLFIGIVGMVQDINKTVIGHNIFWYSYSMITRNLGTELAGIVIVVVIIDYLNERRLEKQQKEQLREQLKRDLASSVRDVAVNALDELEALGWRKSVFKELNYVFIGVQWRGANLKGFDLTGADLTGADLTKAKLIETDLTRANLFRANLTDIDMFNAILVEADLTLANLTRASLARADLTKAILAEANLTGAELALAYLTEADLTNSTLTEAKLTGADLREAKLAFANLDLAFLNEANLALADLTEANLREADLNRATLNGANLTEANLTDVLNYTIQQLLQADLAKGTMPDQTKYEEWIKQQNTLKQHVKEISQETGLNTLKVFSLLRKEFNLSSYKALQDGQLEEAHAFLDDYDWSKS